MPVLKVIIAYFIFSLKVSNVTFIFVATTISFRKTTDLKSPKPIEHLTPMKDNQHTSGISLIRLVNE